jgi:chemotaxis protein CheX
LDLFEIASEGAHPIIGEVHLLEPFIIATRAALGEMAGTEVGVRAMVQKTLLHVLGDISAVVGLNAVSGSPNAGAQAGALVLSFPQQTAAALTGRIMSGVTPELDENLIRDCMGEIANVVTGQAKALLVETPYRFAFSLLPKVVDSKEFRPPSPGLECLIVAFQCDQGEFVMQLFLKM